MPIDRRTLLGAVPALIASPVWARSPLASNISPEINRRLDAILADWPMVVHGPSRSPELIVLTLRSCGYCRAFHRDFPQPPRGRTFGYLVGTYVPDPKPLLLALFKQPTLANFRAYMAGSLAPQSTPASAADEALYVRVRDKLLALKAIGFSGTPMMFLRADKGWHAGVGYGASTIGRLRDNL